MFYSKRGLSRKEDLVIRKEQLIFRKEQLVSVSRKEVFGFSEKSSVSQRSVVCLKDMLCFACFFCVCQLRLTFGSLLGA